MNPNRRFFARSRKDGRQPAPEGTDADLRKAGLEYRREDGRLWLKGCFVANSLPSARRLAGCARKGIMDLLVEAKGYTAVRGMVDMNQASVSFRQGEGGRREAVVSLRDGKDEYGAIGSEKAASEAVLQLAAADEGPYPRLQG